MGYSSARLGVAKGGCQPDVLRATRSAAAAAAAFVAYLYA